jgi:endonuclease YncB( thermonuclease family)
MASTNPWDALGAPVAPQARQRPPAQDWDAVGVPAASPAPPAPFKASAVPAGRPIALPAGVVPHDGDTFPLGGGQNARLYGADAFELGQPGFMPSGRVDLGAQAQAAMQAQLARGGTATPTGASTYGRPVVSLDAGGADAGRSLIEQGAAIPVPSFLATDPARRDEYLAAQRQAIAAERGAYAGQYQAPSDYRKAGASAPMRGKIPMSADQTATYTKLLRDPKTTPADLEAWATSQGQAMSNAGNILQFIRRNPNAQIASYFQQQDATQAPVLPDGPNVVTRTLSAMNEGLADTLGAPVDLVNSGLGLVGLPTSDKPFLGSESIRSGLHAIGIGQTGEGFAPRSDMERYAQSIARGLGQASLPVGATLGIGGRIRPDDVWRWRQSSGAAASSTDNGCRSCGRSGACCGW